MNNEQWLPIKDNLLKRLSQIKEPVISEAELYSRNFIPRMKRGGLNITEIPEVSMLVYEVVEKIHEDNIKTTNQNIDILANAEKLAKCKINQLMGECEKLSHKEELTTNDYSSISYNLYLIEEFQKFLYERKLAREEIKKEKVSILEKLTHTQELSKAIEFEKQMNAVKNVVSKRAEEVAEQAEYLGVSVESLAGALKYKAEKGWKC